MEKFIDVFRMSDIFADKPALGTKKAAANQKIVIMLLPTVHYQRQLPFPTQGIQSACPVFQSSRP